MADLAVIEVGNPRGTNLYDGYQTRIAFSLDPDISFWEKSVTPPGADGGDAVDTTTMRNIKYRTFAPRGLITLTEMTLTVAYDPEVYHSTNGFDDLINNAGTASIVGSITVHFSDGTTVVFFGYLRSFTPNDIVEGTQPEATMVIQPTNWNTTSTPPAEADPLYSVA